MSKNPDISHDNDERTVPLFGTWRNAYLAVVAAFVIEVTLFYMVTRLFS